MKKVFFIAFYALFVLLNACNSQICGSNKAKSAEANACGKCGKTSCSRECGGETAEKAMPSCSLDAKTQITRGSEVFQKTFSQAKEVRELADGYDFVFAYSPEMVVELKEIAVFERKCCASFTWEVVEEPNVQLVHLKVFGSKAIKTEVKLGFVQLGMAHLFND
jgi:hypothetical protein